MKQTLKKRNPLLWLKLVLFLLLTGFTTFNLDAQEKVTGVVKDSGGTTLPGVSVLQKGTTRGASTDFDGNYSIELTLGQKTLVFSYLGFKKVEIPIRGKKVINVTLEEESESLDEIVIVGYGTQKKESVVGAIAQVKGADLMVRAAGLTDVNAALQGNLPGVTSIQGSGIPGQSDMQIFVRGQSTWNGGGQPLILVDGVPRDMGNLDFNDIENLSVLKDASATAVYGVQGANGVILITTKRGKKGKAQLSLTVNSTIKTVSRLPVKLDSYDSVMEANSSVLRELAQDNNAWNFYRPQAIIDKYRNPANEEERLRYPNINWRDEVLKDFAQDYRVNLSVRGGGKSSKYFGSLAFQSVNDIFDGSKYDSGKGYLGEYRYDRFNYRTNLDFDITSTTEFSVNLGGFLGIRESPSGLNTVTNALYEIPSNMYTPVYPDGLYGQAFEDKFGITNSIVSLTNTGYSTATIFQVNTDFILKQKLNFITEGLSFKGRFSMDNRSQSNQSVRDPSRNGIENVIYRVYDDQGNEVIISPNGINDFDFVPVPWTTGASQVSNGTRTRNLLYDVSISYARTFADKHNVTGLALVRRQERARGSQFPVFREDWVSRVTYNYDGRYFIDVSGAYNGSEKYGPGFRFDLFPAVAAGWTMTNESFMEEVDWLNNFKIRGSYGKIGDDSGGSRFGYISNWSSGAGTFINPENFTTRSPYDLYSEASVGNPFLQWETAIKYNIGAEIALFNSKITAEFDYYGEDRSDILIPGSQRAVPQWFGATPPAFNGGEVEVRGYEVVLRANHTFGNGLNIFGDINFSQTRNKVISREDPALRPFWQKAAGYTIGQPRSAIAGDIITNFDDLYSTTPRVNGQNDLRIGYYNLVDYDGDGVYNGDFDNVPHGYRVSPERNWSATVGARYKGWDVNVQFYGTQNANRNVGNRTFNQQTDLIYAHDLGYWTKDNPNATATQRTFSVGQGASNPRQNLLDGSLTRLKSVSMGYNLPAKTCKMLGVSSLRVFANGNNLFLWSDYPDDREFNGAITADSSFRGDYPTLKRFNFGFNLNF